MKLQGKIICGVIGVVLVGGVLIISNNITKQKEIREHESLIAEMEAESLNNQGNDMMASNESTSETLSDYDLEQQAYEQAWGKAPDGFRWDDDGNLVAISSDDMNSEEVLWSYLRALSILDFSSVKKYSSTSMVYNTYENYFSDSALGNTSYYQQFIRKVYKLVLTTLEVDGITNIAVFPDGTNIATVKVKLLDLTDKDFWRADENNLYQVLRGYNERETDNTKASQYLYDYIYENYEKGNVDKRSVTLEIKLTKVNKGGWLISDDTDLSMAISYENGVNIADYILECYNEWYEDTLEEEERIRESIEQSIEAEKNKETE